MMRLSCSREGQALLQEGFNMDVDDAPQPTWTGPTATFRLASGHGLLLTVWLHKSSSSTIAADIAFRFLQRLSLATAERVERLLAERNERENAEPPIVPAEPAPGSRAAAAIDEPSTPIEDFTPVSHAKMPVHWLRMIFGGSARPVVTEPSLGKK
jgi:UDP-GlcNAc:undecaprenyl-phosphate GlcNAc-1-phosphate transferase